MKQSVETSEDAGRPNDPSFYQSVAVHKNKNWELLQTSSTKLCL